MMIKKINFEDVREVLRTNQATQVLEVAELLVKIARLIQVAGEEGGGNPLPDINQEPIIRVLVYSLVRITYGLPQDSGCNFLKENLEQALSECCDLLGKVHRKK